VRKREDKTILIVDDDITSLTASRKILENEYDVCLAKSANMALSILNNTIIDLILLDFEMPAMSGLDFMNYLQGNAAFNYVPVIFVTSHGTQDIITKAAASGAKDFIVKPVTAKVLLEKVRRAMSEVMPENDRSQLLRWLHLLDIACKAGKSADAEKIAEQLVKAHYNVGTDDQLIEIRNQVRKLNYPIAVEKISDLIKNNLFDKTAKAK
jgi:putative two-component system response regulator